ncbi:MAG: type IV toxin-antitoxin system AbiEi family antitoxin [Sphingobacteriales bacterium]|nr:type IV toxin-antitoxin system AbiEi family antitoxin [Sphingobacteriales bacterium]
MEKEIIHIALENLLQNTAIDGFWEETGLLDGGLDLSINGMKHHFVVKIKREVREHQLKHLEDYLQQYENFMLVAMRIFPKVKEKHKQKGIPYLEANGNIFLKKEAVFLMVDAAKAINTEKNKGNRAFTKTGLKVLFYLLQNKEDINLTQRELAVKADVGLGNIPQIIDGLKATGFLQALNNKTYIWENPAALLDRWIAEYATILRPKLLKEKYTFKGNWQDIALKNNITFWGGEPAADLLTNHLRPEKFLIYTRENRMELIKNYRLMPDKNGEIEVLDLFWKQKDSKTVPPLLVYADLMLEGGKRNKETAEKIYDEYIKPNL